MAQRRPAHWPALFHFDPPLAHCFNRQRSLGICSAAPDAIWMWGRPRSKATRRSIRAICSAPTEWNVVRVCLNRVACFVRACRHRGLYGLRAQLPYALEPSSAPEATTVCL